MQRAVALAVLAALAAQCAAPIRLADTTRPQPSGVSRGDATAIRAAALAIGGGTRVRVQLTTGRSMKAVLMAVEGDALVVQPRTRIPEPSIVVPFDQVSGIERDTGMSAGKAVAIGAAIGAATTFGIMALLAALLIDD